ncbi:hypothetical protein GCM10009789_78500 [Kribbella sancticallisti]|uniref:Uncharacterized protein n=1 Tax=Kribbella sancticallisti TaxID=460087 RepID=A0ABN2ENI2_9ACTN
MISPSNIRMVVVFPDPLGPRNPKTLPAGTSRSIASTATCPPRNRFVNPRVTTGNSTPEPTTAPEITLLGETEEAPGEFTGEAAEAEAAASSGASAAGAAAGATAEEAAGAVSEAPAAEAAAGATAGSASDASAGVEGGAGLGVGVGAGGMVGPESPGVGRVVSGVPWLRLIGGCWG